MTAARSYCCSPAAHAHRWACRCACAMASLSLLEEPNWAAELGITTPSELYFEAAYYVVGGGSSVGERRAELSCQRVPPPGQQEAARCCVRACVRAGQVAGRRWLRDSAARASVGEVQRSAMHARAHSTLCSNVDDEADDRRRLRSGLGAIDAIPCVISCASEHSRGLGTGDSRARRVDLGRLLRLRRQHPLALGHASPAVCAPLCVRFTAAHAHAAAADRC